MIWAVLDTNVLVSGFGWPGSVPALVVDRALGGEYLVFTSRHLLRQLARVLAYPKLRRVFDDPAAVLRRVRRVVVVVEPTVRVDVLEDEEDNRLLEVADETGADFVVTGDRALLELRSWNVTRIATPREFLTALEH